MDRWLLILILKIKNVFNKGGYSLLLCSNPYRYSTSFNSRCTSNLAFRWKHQGRTDFRHDYVAVVKSLANSYNCGNIIITADWGSSSYRKEILPEYKQNRKDKYATQTEEEKQAFIDFFEEYEETLELLAEEYQVLRFKGVEADDLAAHLVKRKKIMD